MAHFYPARLSSVLLSRRDGGIAFCRRGSFLPRAVIFVITVIVAPQPDGVAFEQRRPAAGTRPFGGARDGGANGFGIAAVDLFARHAVHLGALRDAGANDVRGRSEERRVGKEGVGTCRSRWSPVH